MAAASTPLEPPFRVHRDDESGVAVIVVEGAVDLATAPTLKTELESIPAASNVVVDLCETRFMDSTGVRILLAAYSALGARLRIACKPAGPISRVFDVMLGGRQHLPIHESRAAALAAF